MKIYRENNKEAIGERKKIEYDEHREQYLQRAKEYSNANKEHLDAKKKERYEKNKDEIIAKEKKHDIMKRKMK